MSVIEKMRPYPSLRERIEGSGQRRSDVPLANRARMAREMAEQLHARIGEMEVKNEISGLEAQSILLTVLNDFAWLLGED